MDNLNLNGQACSGFNAKYNKGQKQKNAANMGKTRTSLGVELPRIDIRPISVVSYASCPLPERKSMDLLPEDIIMGRQAMSAGMPGKQKRQLQSFHSSHNFEMHFSTEQRPFTRQEYKPATATVPKRGLIKLTALELELRNPDLFKTSQNYRPHTENGLAKQRTRIATPPRTKNCRKLGAISRDNNNHHDLLTTWGQISRECSTVGDLQRTVLQYADRQTLLRNSSPTMIQQPEQWCPEESLDTNSVHIPITDMEPND